MTQTKVTVGEDEIEIIVTALNMYRGSSVGELEATLSKYVDKWSKLVV